MSNKMYQHALHDQELAGKTLPGVRFLQAVRWVYLWEIVLVLIVVAIVLAVGISNLNP